MNFKKIILLATLVVLLTAVASATGDGEYTSDASLDNTIEDTSSAEANVEGSINAESEYNNMIKEDKNIKTASRTYDVTDYNSLQEALTSDNYNQVTINLKSNIKLSDNTTLNTLIKQLNINGNGKTINGDNTNRFLEIEENSTVTIKNLKVTNCYYDYSWFGGGAIYNKGTLTITNCSFDNNYAMYGGAIYNYINNLTITDSQFTSNNAGDDGSAIYSLGNLKITNTTFKDNSAVESGGAIQIERGSINITKSTFTNNTARYGGAIDSYGELVITNSIFNANNAVGNWSTGGSIYNCNRLTIINTTISNCSAVECGGAIYNSMATMNMTKSTLSANHAKTGGAIYSMGTINLKNNTFKNNNADEAGCIYLNGTDNTLSNNEFTDNHAVTGGAILIVNRDNLLTDNNFEFNNATNGGAIALNASTNTTIKRNIFKNNTAVKDGAAIYDITNQYTTQIWSETEYSVIEVTITDGSDNIINNNTFKSNKAGNNGKAIKNMTKASIKDNINDTTSICSSTIYLNTTNATITRNIFIDEKTKTTIQVYTTKSIIAENLTLRATVNDINNNKVNNGYVIFKLNEITIKDNKKLTGSTNNLKVYLKNGIATVNITSDLSMRNAKTITAVYSGSTEYEASRSNTANAQIALRNASIVVTTNVKTAKQGQTITLTARVYDITTGQRKSTLIPYTDEYVYFKVNGITLKNSTGQTLKVKVKNGMATVQYKIPLGLSGVTDGKTLTPKNHTIYAGYANKNYYPTATNTTLIKVERSNITITITNATINNRTHKLSVNATIRDYLSNKVIGPNKCIIKVNNVTIKNGTKPIYYYATDGQLTIKNINIPSYNKYNSIEIVTQDRLAYKSQRNTTTKIKVTR